jgi:glycosyltransferase involved in cell wall biosynthesis
MSGRSAGHRPRLLFLSPLVPAGGGNGLAMRTGFFLDAYAGFFDVDLAVIPVADTRNVMTDFPRMRAKRLRIFDRVAADSHSALIWAIADPAARLAAFRQYGRPSLAARTGAEAQRALAEWTGGTLYDAVHVERLYLAPLAEPWIALPASSRPRLFIDCDEDDAETFRRLAAIERRRHREQAAAWKEAEAEAFAALASRVLSRFDLAFAASSSEASSLSARGAEVFVAPNVVPMMATPHVARRARNRKERTVLFVGNMGYLPNDDAALWLLDRIWPRLRRAVRGRLRLLFVGSDPSPALLRLARRQGVQVTGTVAEMAPFYRSADLAVVPIRAGGGTRIKLLEAAAYGVPIVSTRFGAGGTVFRHGHELLLADSEAGFARACADLLRHRGRAARMAARARRKALLNYNAARWARRVGALAANLSARSGGPLHNEEEARCRKS